MRDKISLYVRHKNLTKKFVAIQPGTCLFSCGRQCLQLICNFFKCVRIKLLMILSVVNVGVACRKRSRVINQSLNEILVQNLYQIHHEKNALY